MVICNHHRLSVAKRKRIKLALRQKKKKMAIIVSVSATAKNDAQDVSGDFRLGGGALSAENQFVTWGTAEDDAIDEEGVAIPFTGDFPILIDGTPQDDTTGPSLTPFTGVMPILVAANVAEGGDTSRALPSREVGRLLAGFRFGPSYFRFSRL